MHWFVCVCVFCFMLVHNEKRKKLFSEKKRSLLPRLWLIRLKCRHCACYFIFRSVQVDVKGLNGRNCELQIARLGDQIDPEGSYHKVLVDCFVDWLIDWLINWLVDWLVDCLTDWLIAWLTDWLIDWWTSWLAGEERRGAWDAEEETGGQGLNQHLRFTLISWLIDLWVDWLTCTD